MTRALAGLAVALMGTALLALDAGPDALVFEGLGPGVPVAGRPDAGRNPDHPPTDAMTIGPGTHELLIRVRGEQYATGGVFARLVRGRAAADPARVSTRPLPAPRSSREAGPRAP